MGISYKDLSIPLKIAVIFAWIEGIILIGSFAIGFISGILSVI